MDARLEVVIAGGGVAGLEAAFALRALAGERATVTVVSAEPEFVYLPLAVREPFTRTPPERHPLARVVADAGAEHVADSFRWLDAPGRVLHTRGGRRLAYDVLLLALGARPRRPFRHALTLSSRGLNEQFDTLVAEVGRGRLRRLAALVPSRSGWPLPMYELCLRLSRAAREQGVELELTLATAEEAPLAWFGPAASAAVAEQLELAGVRLITSVRSEVPEPGLVSLRPGPGELEIDQAIAAPDLYGPSTPGVPKRARRGFISIDNHCRVRDVLGVFAAGDATDFPVKFGAVAGQQADTAARAIAAAAGAPVEAEPFAPVIHGALLGGVRPLYMGAHLIGEHAHRSEVSETPDGRLSTRIAAPHLAEYLDSHTAAAAS